MLYDPDQKFYANYVAVPKAKAHRLLRMETHRLIDAQSMEADAGKRRALVWEVERRLAEDASRPALLYSRFANCKQSRLKGLVTVSQQPLQRRRMEDVWLDQ